MLIFSMWPPLLKISYLRAGEGFLEIVFVRCMFVLNGYISLPLMVLWLRQVKVFGDSLCRVCEVTDISNLLRYIYFFFLAAKLIGPVQGCEFFKNVDFFDVTPLNENFLLKGW